MSRCGRWSPALLVALLAYPVSARADQPRVALIEADAELASALAVALSPVGLSVVTADRAAAPSGEPEESPALRRIAEDHDAVAVIWIERFGGAYLLSAYSPVSGRVDSRPLENGPPYDAAGAAAVAFSIKTLLRESGVVETPSYGEPDPAEEADEEDDPDAAESPPEVAEAAEIPAAPADAPTPGARVATTRAHEPLAEPPLATRASVWLELGAAGELAKVAGQRTARVRATAVYWLAATGGRVGVTGSLSHSLAMDVEHEALTADFSAIEAGLGARMRFPITHRLVLVPDVGVAVRLTRLEGEPVDGSGPLSSSRTGAVSEIGVALTAFITARLALAVGFRAALLVRPAVYTWQGDEVLEEPWTTSAAGVCALLAL